MFFERSAGFVFTGRKRFASGIAMLVSTGAGNPHIFCRASTHAVVMTACCTTSDLQIRIDSRIVCGI